jgi:hypothetical protein
MKSTQRQAARVLESIVGGCTLINALFCHKHSWPRGLEVERGKIEQMLGIEQVPNK